MAFSSDSSESDAFDPSPVPIKRRRISPTSTERECPPKQARTKRQPKPKIDPATRVKPGSKHRVINHQRPVNHDEDQILTQVAQDVPSSPWQLRGAKWTKPNPPVEVAEVQGHEDEADIILDTSTCNGAYDNDNLVDDLNEDMAAATQDHNLPIKDEQPRHLVQEQVDLEAVLADLPSDAFLSSSSSPQKIPQDATRPAVITVSSQNSPTKQYNLIAPRNAQVQMNLYGQPVKHGAQHKANISPGSKRFNFALSQKDEPPTHHKLNADCMKSWVYPINIGSIRDYQYNIVQRGLYNNLLVALPTGLGKTFIAATIMLNWYRWTKDSQIVFVAPTQPLVSQQVEACFGIAGIPRSETTMLTGGIQPGLRAEEWSQKRVFFMTPQTVVHDYQSGIADPKKLVLLVVDEAHRATGNYAYVKLVQFIRRFNKSFRVLALTATPGNSVEAVQDVINGLDIARVEIRTESSLDIRQYVHSRKTERKVFSDSDEMELIKDWLSKSLQPVLNLLVGQNAYWERDPLKITPYGLTQARQKWNASDTGRKAHMGIKAMVNRIFSLLASLGHNLELLKYHGLGPFFHNMVRFRNESQYKNGGKYENMIKDNEYFQKMMTRLQFWINNVEFVGHPKLEYLQSLVLEHFSQADDVQVLNERSETPSRSTRIMIFAHFRDSAEEIVRVLSRHKPLIKPHVFVGQSSSKSTEGMDQKKQQDIITRFKSGEFNTLVATSIGEEGLDIGEVDLIVCYDSSSSPIRMLQRMGRTGRKRAGNIVLLLMRGKEEESFVRAKDNYEKMQAMISTGDRFDFHDDRSPRILPKEAEPEPEPRHVEIPVQNTQAALPEPTKKGRRAPKKPPKKFHMPNDVRTGFVRVSRLEGDDEDDSDADDLGTTKRANKSKNDGIHEKDLASAPALSSVKLTPAQQKDFEQTYLQVQADAAQDNLIISAPSAETHPNMLRSLGPSRLIKHGSATKRAVNTIRFMRSITSDTIDSWETVSNSLNVDDLCGPVRAISRSPQHSREPVASRRRRGRPPKNAKSNPSSKTTKQNPKPKTAARKPTAHRPQARNKKKPQANLSDMEAEASSPPATDPRFALPSQGINLGSADTSGEDDEADDYMDSSLRGFVVASDEIFRDGLSSSPEQERTMAMATENISISQQANENSDGEGSSLADVNELMKRRPCLSKESDMRSMNDISPASKRLSQAMNLQTSHTMKKRKIIDSDEDDDDDEDDDK